MCIVLCPYGRIQSALIDDHSLVVGYDARRGEPRRAAGPPGEAPRSGAKPGDCVDCFRCVTACPTGIDIRQGLQMECIGCTACIDACDDVMTRLKRPRGLIRYDSQARFAGGRTRWIRPRTILYFILLMVGAAVAGRALSTIDPAGLGVVRMTGAPYIVDAGGVRNQYLVRLLNKTNETVSLTVSVQAAAPSIRTSGLDGPVSVGPMAEVVTPLVIVQERASYNGPFSFAVSLAGPGGRRIASRQVEFVGPEPRLLREEEAGHEN